MSLDLNLINLSSSLAIFCLAGANVWIKFINEDLDLAEWGAGR